MSEQSMRWRDDFRVVAIHHLADDSGAAETVTRLHSTWSRVPGEVSGAAPWLAWVGPRERWMVSVATPVDPAVDALLTALSTGRLPGCVAIDIGEGLALLECCSDGASQLSRWIDADSLPARAGLSARLRFQDVGVVLLRPDAQRWWLFVERPLRSYIGAWLDDAGVAISP